MKSFALVAHRWLGVSLSLLFALWFASGIGMMYWSYPTVRPADRLEHAASIDPAKVRVSPHEAAEAAGLATAAALRLSTFDGRPAYRFGSRHETVVYADTGERPRIDDELLSRVAARWAGRPLDDARVHRLADVDQWTIQVFRAHAPLRKYSWPSGDEVYVSERSGEVVQATTTRSRIGAYLGPIPHWLYFTPLRKHLPAWTAVVVWSSAAGTLTAIVGILIGVSKYSLSRSYRDRGVPTRIPYLGQKRWHMALGLIFGVGAVTWAFSGMLSMDPFGVPNHPDPDGRRAAVGELSRLPADVIEASGRQHPGAVLRTLAALDVRELEWAAFDGEPIYLATLAGGDTRVLYPDGTAGTEIGATWIAAAVRRAAGAEAIGELRVMDRYDWFYRDRRRQLPLPVVLVALNDEASTRYYFNPKTGRIAGTYSRADRLNRWAYHALHSLDVPWLYNHRPAWDIVVVVFMIGGEALSITSVVLAWRVLKRKLF